MTKELTGTCDNCNFTDPVGGTFLSRHFRGVDHETGEQSEDQYEFCDTCGCTFFSHATSYSKLYLEQALLWKSLGWIANRIRRDIQDLKEAKA